MADWKQITARIRRARTGKDPAGQLSNLFAKTRDAMVAFELARYFESVGNPADAGKWYLTAAERFRRSDWKTKAQESATRLGATEAAEIPAMPAAAKGAAEPNEEEAKSESEPETEGVEAKAKDSEVEVAKEARAETAQPAATAVDKRQRRGRRGGREHRPVRRTESTATAPVGTSRGTKTVEAPTLRAKEEEATPARSGSRVLEQSSEAMAAPSLRGRYGDPGLASRLTQLEMNFRRLLTCDPLKLEEANSAPAGPGVWVLTDSDLTTYYYVEACQTLRVAIPNLLRSGSVRRGESIKPQLAEHLGIPETRVAKYLADHCVVRWLQMDDGATHFAHFLVAVLRPTLNE